MPNLIEEFNRFRATHPRRNPGTGESETTAFMQHLAQKGALEEFTEEDWFKLGERLSMTDDQIGVLLEGTASWIIEEPVPPWRQEPADWPEEVPSLSSKTTLKVASNPAPATRGISSKSARRGTPEFDEMMEDLEADWELEEEELDNIVEIRRAGDSFEIRLKGETRWELIEDDEEEDDERRGHEYGPDEDFGESE